jgi:hypothetical protein
MLAYINDIVYGNPSIEDWNNLQVSNYLDQVIPALQGFPPFYNNSSETRKELSELMELSVTEKPTRKEILDGNLVPFINNLVADTGVKIKDVKAITDQIVIDILPIITKLKYYFNRPRPFQLAYYYMMNFYPHFSHFVSSPSYPSGHSTLAIVCCYVLGHRFPGCYGTLKAFTTEVLSTRLDMGVHFPSDNEFAKKVAEAICSHNQFITNYKL